MGNERTYRTLGELVQALADAEQGLARGALGLDDLERACSDARALYERMVVLRHKAREATLIGAGPVAERSTGDELAEPKLVELEADGIRLDTRPPEAAPRQTSLIEEIEASEQEPAQTEGEKTKRVKVPKATAVSEKTNSKKTTATIAEKLENAAITDLTKAISLSHKFWFVAELFNGDRIKYDKTISSLNSFKDKGSAMDHVVKEVYSKLTKPADPEALSTFTELIQRRFA